MAAWFGLVLIACHAFSDLWPQTQTALIQTEVAAPLHQTDVPQELPLGGPQQVGQPSGTPDQGGHWDKSSITNVVIAFFAGCSVVAAAIQAVIYWKQAEIMRRALIANRRGNIVAKRAANAAEKGALAAKASADALPALERAYVFAEVPAHTMREFRLGTTDFVCNFRFKNLGKTPAVLRKIHIGCEISDGSPAIGRANGTKVVAHFMTTEESVRGNVLGSGQLTETYSRCPHPHGKVVPDQQGPYWDLRRATFIHIREYTKMAGGAPMPGMDPPVNFWLWGSIEYDDLFGKPHYTKFCYVLAWPHGNLIEAIGPEWNERT